MADHVIQMTHEAEEDVKLVSNTITPQSNAQQFREASLLLAMWSILVMNEGVVRFIQLSRRPLQTIKCTLQILTTPRNSPTKLIIRVNRRFPIQIFFNASP